MIDEVCARASEAVDFLRACATVREMRISMQTAHDEARRGEAEAAAAAAVAAAAVSARLDEDELQQYLKQSSSASSSFPGMSDDTSASASSGARTDSSHHISSGSADLGGIDAGRRALTGFLRACATALASLGDPTVHRLVPPMDVLTGLLAPWCQASPRVARWAAVAAVAHSADDTADNAASNAAVSSSSSAVVSLSSPASRPPGISLIAALVTLLEVADDNDIDSSLRGSRVSRRELWRDQFDASAGVELLARLLGVVRLPNDPAPPLAATSPLHPSPLASPSPSLLAFPIAASDHRALLSSRGLIDTLLDLVAPSVETEAAAHAIALRLARGRLGFDWSAALIDAIGVRLLEQDVEGFETAIRMLGAVLAMADDSSGGSDHADPTIGTNVSFELVDLQVLRIERALPLVFRALNECALFWRASDSLIHHLLRMARQSAAVAAFVLLHHRAALLNADAWLSAHPRAPAGGNATLFLHKIEPDAQRTARRAAPASVSASVSAAVTDNALRKAGDNKRELALLLKNQLASNANL
jgi:hypothetical protein